jgi:ArsR family transcriptional regulator
MSKHFTSSRFHPQDQLKSSSAIFRALAHPLRLRICGIIDDKNPACVQEIYDSLGIEQSVVSQHLRILRQANLVLARREGKFVFYLLDYHKMANAGKAAGFFAGYVG